MYNQCIVHCALCAEVYIARHFLRRRFSIHSRLAVDGKRSVNGHQKKRIKSTLINSNGKIEVVLTNLNWWIKIKSANSTTNFSQLSKICSLFLNLMLKKAHSLSKRQRLHTSTMQQSMRRDAALNHNVPMERFVSTKALPFSSTIDLPLPLPLSLSQEKLPRFSTLRLLHVT